MAGAGGRRAAPRGKREAGQARADPNPHGVAVLAMSSLLVRLVASRSFTTVEMMRIKILTCR